jgi:hypothetical protein
MAAQMNIVWATAHQGEYPEIPSIKYLFNQYLVGAEKSMV